MTFTIKQIQFRATKEVVEKLEKIKKATKKHTSEILRDAIMRF